VQTIATRTPRSVFVTALVALSMSACGSCDEQAAESSAAPSARPFNYRWDGGRRAWMRRARDAGPAGDASAGEDAGP
jgi:hypothetical protein